MLANPECPVTAVKSRWSYETAFCRNRGLVSTLEQQRLRNSHVAIAGMGGVGGIELVTLARLGVGKFTIADPDVFETANTNRQFGATCSTVGRSKAEVMAQIVRDINPEAEVRVLTELVDSENVDEFLDGADLFVDAVDFYAVDARRLLFRRAAEKGIAAITAGPIGFSSIWIVFLPGAMSFDEYFHLSDEMTRLQKLVAFGLGIAPKATQRAYMDLEAMDIKAGTAPSSGLACQLAAGVCACEAVKILAGRGAVKPAPFYHQFDPFMGQFVHRRLRGGNRHPLQRVKRWLMERFIRGQMERREAHRAAEKLPLKTSISSIGA